MLHPPTNPYWGAAAANDLDARRPAPRIRIHIAGEGRPVVLLHSSSGVHGGPRSLWRSLSETAMSERMQRHLAERIGRGYKLIAVDLPAHVNAASPGPRDALLLATDVALAQVRLAGILAPDEDFHLVGLSYGGGVALQLACRNVERIRSLTLFEPAPSHSLTSQDAAIAGVQTPSEMALFDCGATAHFTPLSMPACLIEGRDSPACARRAVDALMAVLTDVAWNQVEGGPTAPLVNFAAVNSIVSDFIRATDAAVTEGSEPCMSRTA
jgi:pimeloyl-ACP methyl ester carboxylesterase